MSEELLKAGSSFDKEFYFESFGVGIRVASDSWDLVDEAKRAVVAGFGEGVEITTAVNLKSVEHDFCVSFDGIHYLLFRNGEQVTYGTSKKIFFKNFNSRLRVEVAEFAKSKVFLHAGVVGWKGSAIVVPAKSFEGKSTLTAELVKNGAEYYSDEYAVLDETGNVHPFPRKISMRYFGATREKEVSVEEIGGKYGVKPLPVGMVLLTGFAKGGVWSPEVLGAGSGIMAIIPHTIPITRDPEFSLKVLDLVARRAIIVRSPRGDAKKFARLLLDFFENHIKVVKLT